MQSKTIPKQVFLSHLKNDKDLTTLAKALSRELKRRGYRVWTDERILPGTDWSVEIERALKESDAMVALLNQHSFSSSYVRDALEHAFFDEKYKNRLLSVLIGETSEDDFSRLPWVLKKMPFLKISSKQSSEDLAKTIADKFQDLLKGRGVSDDT